MVNTTEYAKAQSPYLKAKDIVSSPTKEFIITKDAIMVNKEFEGIKSEKLQVEGEMDAIAYKFDISKTNTRTIAKELGSDTLKWIGSKLILETYKTKNSKNVLIDAINVKTAVRLG